MIFQITTKMFFLLSFRTFFVALFVAEMERNLHCFTIWLSVLLLSTSFSTAINDACTFCRCTYQNVDCTSKKLTAIPNKIPVDTITLTLNGNNFRQLPPNAFGGLVNLQYLFIHKNQLLTISIDAFKGLKNLKTLSLTSNQLSEIKKDWFTEMIHLQILNIDKNKIKTVQGYTFQSMKFLKYALLQDNIIEYIKDYAFYGLSMLSTIVLTNNRISQIEKNAFNSVSSSTTVSLNNNPLICDCVLYSALYNIRGSVSGVCSKDPKDLLSQFLVKFDNTSCSTTILPSPSTKAPNSVTISKSSFAVTRSTSATTTSSSSASTRSSSATTTSSSSASTRSSSATTTPSSSVATTNASCRNCRCSNGRNNCNTSTCSSLFELTKVGLFTFEILYYS